MTEIVNREKRPPLTGVREVAFRLADPATDDQPNDGLTLDGWALVFGAVTVVDSWEGRFREVLAPGCARRSLRERPPILQLDHGSHPLVGSLPIASLVSAAEEIDPVLAPEGGVHVVARLFDNWMLEPLRQALAAGAINGMSFRFEVIRETWTLADGTTPITSDMALLVELEKGWDGSLPDSELPIRTLRELRVPELGPVVWPQYESTSVTVRSGTIDLNRLHEPEQRSLLARAVFTLDSDVARGAPREIDEAVRTVRNMLLQIAQRRAWLAGLPGSVEQDGGALGVAFNAGVQAAHGRAGDVAPTVAGEREVDRGARLVRAMLDDINARRDMMANRGRRRGRFEEPDTSVYTYSQAAQRLSRLRGEFLALQQKGEHLLTDDDMRHADELRGEITALRRFEGDGP